MPEGGGRLIAARYRLLDAVGRGGMGTVWHARDEALDRDVAVKEVNPHPGLSDHDREISRKRTLREARTAARLSHPGVVAVYDVVEEDDRPWIVMELVLARSLSQIVAAGGALPPARVVHIGRQMLSALRAAHRAGVLHRDVKPSNVLLTDSDRAVLTDFGIATSQGDATLTQTGLVMGSPAYIAPERARGGRAQPSSDLFSLGVTLYAALEGRSPFERSEPLASMLAVITEQPKPPRAAGGRRLWPVLEGLLRKDPEHRLTAESATAMLERVAWEYRQDAAPRPRTTKPLPALATATTVAPAPLEAPERGEPARPIRRAEPVTPVTPPDPARRSRGREPGRPADSAAPAAPTAPAPSRTPRQAPGTEPPARTGTPDRSAGSGGSAGSGSAAGAEDPTRTLPEPPRRSLRMPARRRRSKPAAPADPIVEPAGDGPATRVEPAGEAPTEVTATPGAGVRDEPARDTGAKGTGAKGRYATRPDAADEGVTAPPAARTRATPERAAATAPSRDEPPDEPGPDNVVPDAPADDAAADPAPAAPADDALDGGALDAAALDDPAEDGAAPDDPRPRDEAVDAAEPREAADDDPEPWDAAADEAAPDSPEPLDEAENETADDHPEPLDEAADDAAARTDGGSAGSAPLPGAAPADAAAPEDGSSSVEGSGPDASPGPDETLPEPGEALDQAEGDAVTDETAADDAAAPGPAPGMDDAGQAAGTDDISSDPGEAARVGATAGPDGGPGEHGDPAGSYGAADDAADAGGPARDEAATAAPDAGGSGSTRRDERPVGRFSRAAGSFRQTASLPEAAAPNGRFRMLPAPAESEPETAAGSAYRADSPDSPYAPDSPDAPRTSAPSRGTTARLPGTPVPAAEEPLAASAPRGPIGRAEPVRPTEPVRPSEPGPPTVRISPDRSIPPVGTAGPVSAAKPEGASKPPETAANSSVSSAAEPLAVRLAEARTALAGTSRRLVRAVESTRLPSRTVMVGAAVAVVLVIVVWALLANGAGASGRSAGQTPAKRPATPAAPAPAQSQGGGQSTGKADGVPAGFRKHKDRIGFSVAVPAGWTGPERKSAGVFFYSPDRSAYIQIAHSSQPRPDALADWRDQERATKGGFRDYRRVRLEKIDYKDSPTAADWEFTWSSDSGRRHILDRGFVLGDNGYAILIAAPDAGWAQTIKRLQPVFDSFTSTAR